MKILEILELPNHLIYVFSYWAGENFTVIFLGHNLLATSEVPNNKFLLIIKEYETISHDETNNMTKSSLEDIK